MKTQAIERFILLAMSNVEGITVSEIKERLTSNSRKTEAMKIRHFYRFMSCKHIKTTLKIVGSKSANADHTTVINSRNTVEDLLAVNDKTEMGRFYSNSEIEYLRLITNNNLMINARAICLGLLEKVEKHLVEEVKELYRNIELIG